MVSIQVDIIGGSLSGLSSAISLKEKDPSIRVIVHEKYKKIGFNYEGRRCGEAHTVLGQWNKWKPESRSVFNELRQADVTVGRKRYQIQIPPGVAFMLNRQEFICQLARVAEEKGAEVRTDEKITSLEDLDGEYVIDASGCPSTVKRILGLKQEYVGTTYQQTIQDAGCFVADTMRIIFTSYFGYFWIFPRNPATREVNVGVGILGDYGYHLKEILEQFKKEQNITGTVNFVVAGPVPLGLQHPLRHKNILFVGDAGVGAFPFNGQGIYRALMSGEIAGSCIAKKRPQSYPACINQEFLKWDMFGSLFIRVNQVFRKINSELFYTSVNLFTRSGKRLNPLATH